VSAQADETEPAEAAAEEPADEQATEPTEEGGGCLGVIVLALLLPGSLALVVYPWRRR
jgi:hypothetical protein